MDAIATESDLAQAISRMRIAGTDTQRFEVKSCRKELTRDIGRTLSGFSNGSGGTLVCGIDENNGFKPVEGFDPSRIQDALANFCSQRMTPPVRPVIDILPFEGAPVLVASIPELVPKQKPCYVSASGCYGGSYVRVGDGDRKLSGYEIDRLISEHAQPRFDDAIVGEATRDDLDAALVAGLLKRERSMHPRNLGALSDETVLRKLHVLKTDDCGTLRPTVAGLVALGTYPQEFFPRLAVSFTCYPGVTKTEALPDGRRFVDSFTCTGPIPAMVEDAVAAVTRNMRVGSRIEGAFRYDVPDYPPLALREAITNALMHRDYSPDAQGSAVNVDMYADRLEIVNAGGLFGTVTLDDLRGALATGSCRNQFLATILESTPQNPERPASGNGFVAENRGTGYLVIEQELRRFGKPAPVPRDSLSHFCLTMFKEPPGSDASANAKATGNAVSPSLGADAESIEYAIVEIAAGRETVSMRDLMSALNRSRPTVGKYVSDLIRRGILAPTQAKNSPRQSYRLVDR